MPLPDKYKDEPTVEVDPDLVQAWRQAEDAAKQWKAHAEALKRKLVAAIGANHAGTVNGTKLVTNRPSDGYATARLIEEYPDLTRFYLREKPELVLDVEAFRIKHGEILERYRIRSCRYVRPVDEE